MDLINAFKRNWQQEFEKIQPAEVHLLLAVSGGVDSVVLTDLVVRAGFECSIAHCNYQLRGVESDRDELLVRSLQKVKEIFVRRFDTASYADTHKMAIQEAARKLRYEWFAELQGQLAIQYPGKKIWLLTAHHGDDNIETVLMHFFRGTGVQGLRGILPMQEDRSLIRPLLCFRKEELLKYAAANWLEFREDASNQSEKYTRNFFRNKLIPEISQVFPTVEENILQNIERMRDVSMVYQQSIDQLLSKLVQTKGKELQVPILRLKKHPILRSLIWEFIKPFGFSAAQVPEILKLMDAANGACVSSTEYRIIRDRKWLIMASTKTAASGHIVMENPIDPVSCPAGIVAPKMLHHAISKIDQDPMTAFLNAAKISFPLILRKARMGDYFYPLGMQKKKKLSRFLIDQKCSKTAKENCWVLESDKKIVWVIGYRIDDRFKISDRTETVLQLHWTAS